MTAHMAKRLGSRVIFVQITHEPKLW